MTKRHSFACLPLATNSIGLVNDVHSKKLNDWRAKYEEERMITMLNESVAGHNRGWFICHSCYRLFIPTSFNDIYEFAILRNETNTGLFCRNCTSVCDGCGSEYCSEIWHTNMKNAEEKINKLPPTDTLNPKCFCFFYTLALIGKEE